ncbi:MAG: hypothetical protein QM742_16670 [Aquabacterium sp.]
MSPATPQVSSTFVQETTMNYLIGLLVVMAIILSIATFPVPTIVALVVAAVYWLVKGRKGRVR